MLPAMKRSLSLLALVVLGVAIWSPALGGTLLTDDIQYTQVIRRNVSLNDGLDAANVGRLLGAYTHPWKKNPNLVRPSVYVSHAVHLLTTGVNPRPFLIVNLAGHLLNGLLLFALLSRALPTVALWARTVATAAFLTSPFAIEPVAWSAARSDLFMTTFGLLGLLLWFRGERWRIAAYVSVAGALTFKESAIVYVAALGILELFPEDGGASEKTLIPPRRWRWRRLVFPLLLGLVYLAWRGHMLAGVMEARYLGKSFLETMLTEQTLRNLWRSALRFFAPVSTLVVDRPAPFQLVVGPILFLGLVRGLIAVKGRVLWVALALLLVPVGLGVTVGAIMPTLFHGRQAYGSLPGFAVFTAAALGVGPRLFRLPLCLAFLALMPLSYLEARGSAHMGRQVMSLVHAVREPIFRDADPPPHGVVVLRWETKLFHGMPALPEVILHDLLQPPFTQRDVEVRTVSKTEELAAFASEDTTRLVFEVLGKAEESPGLEAVVPARFRARPEIRLDLVAPSQGWTYRIDGNPRSTGFDLVWRSSAPPGSRFIVGVLASRLGVGEQSPPAAGLDVSEDDGLFTYRLHIPRAVITARARGIVGRETLGSYVKLEDESGRLLACTGVRLYFIAGQ